MARPIVAPAGALLVLCSCACALACGRGAPPAREAPAPDGARLYARACAKCHAEDGRGGLPMAENGPRPIDFRDPAWHASRSDAEITAAIRDGRGAMPPFNDVLHSDEIAALSRYVRQLGAKSR
jgi:mono/diheme cytochrome c family protein